MISKFLKNNLTPNQLPLNCLFFKAETCQIEAFSNIEN
jgi:hypothetical protein